MSETLWAVLITGVVTLSATWVGPVISERATRTRDATSRRDAAASGLRPLGIDAIEATRTAVNLTESAMRAGRMSYDATIEFRATEERGNAAYVAALQRSRRALTELELSTSDPLVNEVVGGLLNALDIAASQVYWLHVQVLHRQPANQPAIYLIEVSETSIYRGLDALKLVLQPLTSFDGRAAPSNEDRTDALSVWRDAYSTVREAIENKSGDYSGSPEV